MSKSISLFGTATESFRDRAKNVEFNGESNTVSIPVGTGRGAGRFKVPVTSLAAIIAVLSAENLEQIMADNGAQVAGDESIADVSLVYEPVEVGTIAGKSVKENRPVAVAVLNPSNGRRINLPLSLAERVLKPEVYESAMSAPTDSDDDSAGADAATVVSKTIHALTVESDDGSSESFVAFKVQSKSHARTLKIPADDFAWFVKHLSATLQRVEAYKKSGKA